MLQTLSKYEFSVYWIQILYFSIGHAALENSMKIVYGHKKESLNIAKNTQFFFCNGKSLGMTFITVTISVFQFLYRKRSIRMNFYKSDVRCMTDTVSQY